MSPSRMFGTRDRREPSAPVTLLPPANTLQVGDMVECQPEENTSWIRGTVVNIALAQAMYDVALESVRNLLVTL